ncbi:MULTISPECIES: diacylglycerol/lipid kinase family protein [Enterococcus]|uniref:Diacylglycerol kinase n=1 Tax=Enterococcus thailandicus TaxID=417368 RepID=A0A179EST6_ENTTH|nr:diacylglycerol kinase family protein [Enterococcus thailandicus]MDK4351225.1 diacylglycerol kinase family lipid kinase [Enterococcus thailandicus]MDT2733041.1 diacylglycerol kinase family lipid kinase [Enterococcus thailandicus]OAQ56278.1 diacylglycerol kinase [Enterococcus thailandicus]GMC04478.1 diacylglycerol kinase [Enterococcus thailandicus]GMC08219.1 diacylglycerol kinase [Enterococcus thailandicus]
MKKLLVFYNKSSGKDEGEKLAKWFQQYAKNKQPDLEIQLTQTGPEIRDETLIEKAESFDADTLIIIGGDGTIHHIVKAFQKTIENYHIGLLPGGTVNNLARVLEIPLEKKAAADVILTAQTKAIDYGTVNDSVIISTLTVGLLADTAMRVSQEEKQKFGPWAFAKRFIKLVVQKRRYRLTIQTDDKKWEQKVQLLTVTMTNSVGGYTNFDDLASPDDGKFHVTIIPKLNFFSYVFYLPRILRGKFYTVPGIDYYTTSELRLASEKKVGTRTDGETTDNLPIKMTVIPKGLVVYVPKNK